MPSKPSRGLASLVALATTAALAGPAGAASPSPLVVPPAAASSQPPDVQAARALFALAEGDEDAGRWGDALEKLLRVLSAKDTAGVRYHVALCEEHIGRLAEAQSEYAGADTSARAEKAGDVLRLVGRKLTDIAARVPHATSRRQPAALHAPLSL